MSLDDCSCWLTPLVKWEKPGHRGDGDEEGIRGLGLAESLGDSVAPDTRWFTAGCPSSIPARSLAFHKVAGRNNHLVTVSLISPMLKATSSTIYISGLRLFVFGCKYKAKVGVADDVTPRS